MDRTKDYETLFSNEFDIVAGQIVFRNTILSEVKVLYGMVTDWGSAYKERVRVSDVVD